MTRRRYLPLFGMLVVLALQSLWTVEARAEDRRKLSLIAAEYPPYTASDVLEQGLVSAVVEAAFKAEGYDSTLVFQPFSRALTAVEEGRFDGMLAIWYQTKRADYLAFSEPVWMNQIGFYERQSRSIDVSNLQRLTPYTIGVVRDYANPPEFVAAGLKTDSTIDDLTNMRKLIAGRIDLALIDKTLAEYLMTTTLKADRDSVVWHEPAVASMPLYIGISRKAPGYQKILADFNHGLAELRRTGEFERIVRQIAPQSLP